MQRVLLESWVHGRLMRMGGRKKEHLRAEVRDVVDHLRGGRVQQHRAGVVAERGEGCREGPEQHRMLRHAALFSYLLQCLLPSMAQRPSMHALQAIIGLPSNASLQLLQHMGLASAASTSSRFLVKTVNLWHMWHVL